MKSVFKTKTITITKEKKAMNPFRIFLVVSIVLMTIFWARMVTAENHSDQALEFNNMWARASLGTSTVGAVYGTVTNASEASMSIQSARADFVDKVEFHTHVMDDKGIMRMRPVASLSFEGKETIQLKPGGFHMMLIGLQEKLEIGDKRIVELKTHDGHLYQVRFHVVDPTAKAADMMKGHFHQE